jgi:hypothetical protein
MYRKFTGIFVIAFLVISLTGVSWLFIGCSSQENSAQNPSQTAGEVQQPSDMQPPEGMEPPAGGGRPEGMPRGMGFNMSDEEFQELLDKAVTDGTITDEESAEILAWWQNRPEFDSEEIDEAQMQEMSEWMQQQPESAMEIFGGMRGPGGGAPPAGGGGPPQQPQQ